MFKGLLLKGANTGDGWNYWLIKNEEINNKENNFFKVIGTILYLSFVNK